MGEGHAPMSDRSALIEHRCAKRSGLVQTMAACPEPVSDEHIRDLAWPQSGSVRTRASEYCLSWDEANPGSRGWQDGQHGHTPPEMEE
jgi:hypothetical protein